MHENVASPTGRRNASGAVDAMLGALTAARSSPSRRSAFWKALLGPPGNYSMVAVWIACRSLRNLLPANGRRSAWQRWVKVTYGEFS